MNAKKLLLLLFSVFILSCGGDGGDSGPGGYAPIYASASNIYTVTKYEFSNGPAGGIAAACLNNPKIKTIAGSNELVLEINITNTCLYNNATNPVTMFDFGLTNFTPGASYNIEVLMNTNPKYSGFVFDTSPIVITETLSNGDKLTIEAAI